MQRNLGPVLLSHVAALSCSSCLSWLDGAVRSRKFCSNPDEQHPGCAGGRSAVAAGGGA